MGRKKGIMRQLDSAGRIVIPKEYREQLDTNHTSDKFEIFLQDDMIVLKKFQPACIFCNTFDWSINYEGHCVCEKCVEKMMKQVEQERLERQKRREDNI